jgi:hypothetical protein
VFFLASLFHMGLRRGHVSVAFGSFALQNTFLSSKSIEMKEM